MASAAQPEWDEIVRTVAEQLGLPTRMSATLVEALLRGARYLVVDHRARQLVFDMRALFLGFLEAGRLDRESKRLGNTATWLAAWIGREVGEERIARALGSDQKTPLEDLAAAAAKGYAVIASMSVRGLSGPAQKIAIDTGRPAAIEARHLFAAMIVTDSLADQARVAFDVDIGPRMDALKAHLVSRIMTEPLKGETTRRWCAVLGVTPEQVEAAEAEYAGRASVPPPKEEVAGFNRDSVPPSPSDPLRTQDDAEAIARLMCLEDAAPLAVAVFGGWGSGKSTFMNRLDTSVRRITEDGTGDAQPESPPGPTARFVERVVQIRFNAWQFVDANLWASLTSEFFDQLRAGGWDRSSGARHAGLVERVNRHVHSLNAEVEARREAAATGGIAVLQAQKARDAAATAAEAAPGATLGQAALDTLGEAYEAQKPNLSALGLAVSGVDTARAVDAIVEAASAARSIGGQALAIWKVLAKSKRRLWLSLGLLALAAAAAVALAVQVVRDPQDAWNSVVAGLTALGALGAAAAAITASPAFKLVRDIVKRSADIALQVSKADREALNELLKKEVALREATVEAEALQAAAVQASQRLARYVSPDGSPNPPRLLRYVLEDDPDTKALAAEIGLIGRTRRLFQAVDDIAREERRKPPAERDGAPDRIILYIDDLDRCTDEQVYNVLQAIHLLLAFELFVVVVGVDVKRVQGALARALAPREAGGMDPEDLTGLAAAYLEKIFQVAFWLAPLTAGDDGGSFGRYVRDLAEPSLAPTDPGASETAEGGRRGPPAPTIETIAATDTTIIQARSEPPPAADDDMPARRRRSLATIQLTQDEVRFLASAHIAGVAARTPRGVKRLLNVYRLVRSRLSAEGVSILGDATTPPAYPVIALMVAVETGQPVEVADDLFEGLKALNPLEHLDQSFESKGNPGAPIAVAYAAAPALRAAMIEVLRLRHSDLHAGEALRIARVARRFSFNVNS